MSSWCRTLPQASRQLLFALVAGLLLLPLPALAQNGNVSGRVTDAATGAPVATASVAVVTVTGSQVSTTSTNASGDYQLSVPPGALYYLVARNSLTGHVTQAHPDVRCVNIFSCSSAELTTAEPFSVAAGGTVTGRDFTLTLGGRISGRVTSASTGAGVANVLITTWTRVGASTAGLSTSSQSDGAYTLAGLPAGTYYLHTGGASGLRNEVYDNVPCIVCTSALAFERGTPVVVTSGATASARDFALDPAGTISGTVTSAETGGPLQGVFVNAYRRDGTSVFLVGSAVTNGSGQYAIAGLPSGDYGVATSSNSTTNEIHSDILCAVGCSPIAAVDSGHPVTVTQGATTGIDFALSAGGQIAGTVVNEATGLPAAGVNVIAVVPIGTGFASRVVATSASGAYTIAGLPAAIYALYTTSTALVGEVYDNLPCEPGCNSSVAWSIGTPVVVTAGATTGARNFSLAPRGGTAGGTVGGTLTDAAMGLPLAGITLELWRATASGISFVTTAQTALNGRYSFGNQPAGSYRVATFGIHPFRNKAYANFECLGPFCPSGTIAAATAVSLTSGGTPTADIQLSAGDGLTGVITDAASGALLTGVTVTAYQVSGAFAGTATANRGGRYAFRHLPNGQYVVFTSNGFGYFDEIHGNIRCTGPCAASTALASGTRITVSGAPAAVDLSSLVGAIDFALDARTQAPAAPLNLRAVTQRSTTEFTWTAPALTAGAAAASYLIEAGVSPGTTIVTLPAAGTSLSVPGVPPGTYHVRVRGVNAFGTGPASIEVVLTVGGGGTSIPEPPTNLLSYVSAGALTMTWSPATTGGPAGGYIVEVGSSGGTSNIATVPVTTARFTYNPVPNGVYFFRVRARNAAGVGEASAEVMVVVGNVPPPPGAPNLTTASVTGSTVALTWQPPARGTPTSYIVEAGSAPGLSDLASVNIGTPTMAQFGGVPRGTYYVRIRAVNAQGVGIASNERILTVP